MGPAGPYANHWHLAVETVTMHHSFFYRPDALHDAQPTVTEDIIQDDPKKLHIFQNATVMQLLKIK